MKTQRRLHVCGEEVVLVDADLQVGLHSRFVDWDVLLDRGLTRITTVGVLPLKLKEIIDYF